MEKKPWFSDKTTLALLIASGTVFLAAMILHELYTWLTPLAETFWIFNLVCLIQRDLARKKFSLATAFYILQILVFAALFIYALAYNLSK